jgi:hypothetical protein
VVLRAAVTDAEGLVAVPALHVKGLELQFLEKVAVLAFFF